MADGTVQVASTTDGPTVTSNALIGHIRSKHGMRAPKGMGPKGAKKLHAGLHRRGKSNHSHGGGGDYAGALAQAAVIDLAKGSPPNLRNADGDERCGTCRHFDDGKCALYGGYSVRASQVCDSYSRDTNLSLEDLGHYLDLAISQGKTVDFDRLSDLARTVDLVGPHGFVHNWIKVGPGEGGPLRSARGIHAIGKPRGKGGMKPLPFGRSGISTHRRTPLAEPAGIPRHAFGQRPRKPIPVQRGRGGAPKAQFPRGREGMHGPEFKGEERELPAARGKPGPSKVMPFKGEPFVAKPKLRSPKGLPPTHHSMARTKGTLNAAGRKSLRSSQFALPGRKYPIHDRGHAANAKARAKQMMAKGRLSPAQYRTVVRKANKVLAAS